MFGEPAPNTKVWDDSLEHRLLEEELDLQLSLLKDEEEMHKASLFPEVEDQMEELPHLKDGTLSAHDQEIIHKAQLELALEESVMEESVLEAAVICGMIALLFVVPQLINF
jgi:hypothetical protein